MGVEVHSLAQLNGKTLDSDGLAYLMPSNLPFTAATVSLTISQFIRAGFDDVCVYYDAKYSGLVVWLGIPLTPETITRTKNLQVSLRSDAAPSRNTLDVLSIDCSADFPQIVIEPDQVLNADMFNNLVNRFDGSLAHRRDDWTATLTQGAFVLEHLNDEEYQQSKEQEELESVIGYADMALRVVAKYLYSGQIWAWCTFDGNRPIMINHHIRIVSPIAPNHLDIDSLRRVPGVVSADASDDLICIHTQGATLRAYRDSRQFLAEVHALGVRLAKTLSIFPLVGCDYEIGLGGPAKLVQLFDVPSDQPKG